MTNGAILPGMGRSAWVRRLKDLVALHIADLGGDANVSEAERAIVRRAAVIITELERMEKNFALSEGAPGISELETYQRMANTMRRLLEAVGLQRRPRDVTPTLGQYLSARTIAVNGAYEAAGESKCGRPELDIGCTGNRTGEASADDSVS
jgi:hypothetical protein